MVENLEVVGDLLDYFGLCVLMAIHLDEKRSLAQLREALDYEEYKGIFRGWKLNDLRDEYEEKKKMFRKLEKMLLSQCPSFEKFWKDLDWGF